MEPADATGGVSATEGSFGFPRRQGSAKPSHRRAASSPAIDHDFSRSGSSIYSSSGPFGVLGDHSNGLFSPRLAIGMSKGHHRETASGDFTMSTEAGDTSFTSVDSLFHRGGGLESLRSDFLKMDLGRRRIGEDERVNHHPGSESTDTVSAAGPATSASRGVSPSLSRSMGAGAGNSSSATALDIPDRPVHASTDLRMLPGSSSSRRAPTGPPAMDRDGSSVGVPGVLGGPGAGPGGGGSGVGGGGGVGASANAGGADGSRVVSGGVPSRVAPSHQNHHTSNGRTTANGSSGGGSRAANGGNTDHRDRDRDRGRHSSAGTGGVYRNHGGSRHGGSNGQGWSVGSGTGAVDDSYLTFTYRDPLLSAGGGAGGIIQAQSSPPPPPPGVPMYALQGDGYSTIPIQHTYALNSESYSQGVVGHLPPHPHAHGLGQMQGHQGGGLDVSAGGVGDQQMLGAHVSAMGSPPHPPLPAPQQMYMSAQNTYVVTGGNGNSSNGTSAASSNGVMGAASGGGGGGGNANGNGGVGSGTGSGSGVGANHVQAGSSTTLPPAVMLYQPQHQPGNVPPQSSQPQAQSQPQQQSPPQQAQPQIQQQPPQQVQTPAAAAATAVADSAAVVHASAHPTAASQMYLPMSQASYGYIPPHIGQLQAANGVPIYQVAGPGLEASPASARANGGAGGGAGAGPAGSAGGGRANPGSPSLASPPATTPQAPHPAGPQGFQVHYALTPQGIVPMVPIMPNGAGFANPALYPGLGSVYDDGRGLAGLPLTGPAAIDGTAALGVDKGRLSPPLAAPALHPRFSGSPPPHHPHVQHAHLHGALQPLHAPAWGVAPAGLHDPGHPYHDGIGVGVSVPYNDRGYGGALSGNGGGSSSDGYRGGGGGGGGREGRMSRDGDSGKDVKDRRKRLDRESDMAALLEATRPALKDVLGKVYSMSRDQVGCRLLQQKLDECPDRPPDGDVGKEGGSKSAGTPLTEEDAVTAIFEEALPDLPQMMVDPFGNYLFQKLFVKIDDHQRLLAVKAVTDRMPEAAVNLHGTRCVQKVVELCRTDAQAAVIAKSLGPSVVKLSLDPNGNHVVQRALQHMPAPRNDFVLEAIIGSLVQVAVHRHGCCVLQRCLDAAGPKLRTRLVDEVARNGLKLMQDPFGNYVVQYVLKTCSREETYALCSAPLGHVASLSTQKFSSNVMEACLERALPEVQSKFVEELANQGRIRELILDQYANYVVQRALTVANNEEGLKLVAAIRPHLHSMQSTSSGRRIAAKIIKRYPTVDLGEEILMLMSRG